MTNKLFILFTALTIISLYSSYTGLGLEEIKQESPQSSRVSSSRSYSSGGWSFGK